MPSGHVEKRSKNSHTIVIEAGKNPANGKRQRIYRTVKGNSKEVELEKARILLEVDKGTYIKPSKLTVKDYFIDWLEDYGKLKLAPKTYERYTGIIELRVIPWIGAIELEKLRPADLRKFYNRLLTEGRMDGRYGVDGKPGKLSPDSIKYHHRVMHRILEHAVKIDEILIRNVADIAKPIIPEDYYEDELEKEDVSFLDRGQIKILETNLKKSGSNYYELVFVDIRTGKRRGELLGLKWQDINYLKGTLHIRRALSYTKKKGIFFKRTKGKKNRIIDISAEVVEVFKQLHLKQTKAKLKMDDSGQEYDDQNLVFCQYNGKPMHPDTPTSWFPNYLKSIGLPGLNFHCLRHTHASLLLEAASLSPDITMKMISERLGHSSIRITMDIYGHLMPGMQKNAVKNLDKLLKK